MKKDSRAKQSELSDLFFLFYKVRWKTITIRKFSIRTKSTCGIWWGFGYWGKLILAILKWLIWTCFFLAGGKTGKIQLAVKNISFVMFNSYFISKNFSKPAFLSFLLEVSKPSRSRVIYQYFYYMLGMLFIIVLRI